MILNKHGKKCLERFYNFAFVRVFKSGFKCYYSASEGTNENMSDMMTFSESKLDAIILENSFRYRPGTFFKF